ncbi:unnamed protein product, partial [Adineta steineri]
MDPPLKLGLYDLINTNESESRKQHQHVTKAEYSPVGSSRKLNLLLQRSLRYSYRQRYCRYCPTILCELLFPLILIGLLALTRHETEALSKWIDMNSLFASRHSYHHQCPQNRNTTITTSLSTDSIKNCFKVQPCSEGRRLRLCYSKTASSITNFVFQPITNDIKVLVERAKTRLKNMNCTNIKVSNQNMGDKNDSHLLQNETKNTVIIDFGSTSNLKNRHNLDYKMIVQTSSIVPKTDPVDLSFLSFLHPSFIRDQSNVMDSHDYDFEAATSPNFSYAKMPIGSRLPEFSDVKMFIDALLIGYQTNRNITFELQRAPITCTPYRRDFIFESGSAYVTIVLMFIDFVYFIPYLILLISLIREKNAKVKEILKVIGIEPIL